MVLLYNIIGNDKVPYTYKTKNNTTMNPIFMPRIMPHCGGGGNFTDLPTVLLTFAITGVILIILGILANILHVKFSQGLGASIRWADIKPDIDNSFLGCLGGVLGVIFITASSIIGLGAFVYCLIITL